MVCQDLPDYSRKVIIEYTGGFIGLEELAVRLKSIVPWDLKGNVVLMEDFETEETEWTTAQGGGGSLASRSSRQKYSGNWAIKLFVDDVDTAYASCSHRSWFPGVGKYTHFCRLRIPVDLKRFWFRSWFFSGTHSYGPGLRYDETTGILEVEGPTDDFNPAVAGLTLVAAYPIWVPISYTFDLVNDVYVSCTIGETTHDLSAFSTGKTPDVVNLPVLTRTIMAEEAGDVGYTLYADDVILLNNVP